ncbi:MAG: putative transporter [Bacteroidales bacterium]|nr:putative transporter [Bacteroidales bacterium]
MEWLTDILFNNSVAHTILVYCVVIAAGIALGKIRIFNVSLGIAFVLFAGIAAGHSGFRANHEALEFVRDFGLILFVFSIGLQVGPSFFSSFRKTGVIFNMLALAIVITGAALTVIIHFLSDIPMPVMAGIMSGAVTNTPGLGAVQQTLSQLMKTGLQPDFPDPGIGYAVAYPFGVLGVILSMIIIKKISGINLVNEQKEISEARHPSDEVPEKATIRVTSSEVTGKSVREITGNAPGKMIISRLLHKGNLVIPGPDRIIEHDDIILIVAGKKEIDPIVTYLGTRSDIDLSARQANLVTKRIVVTNTELRGKTLGSLRLRSRYNINITRIERSGIELVANPGIELQMGDRLTIVGDEKSIEIVAREVGNSLRRLYEPNLLPVFTGIILGVITGSIPIRVPGLSNPLKLGLAGGPLIVAIIISKYGHRFSLAAYTTPSANLMMRELGIVLFLASVGLKAGESFVPALKTGGGFIWMGYGAVITMVPVLIIGFIARKWFRFNFFEICGLLSGSMTDPPALAYSNSLAESEAPAVSYATVYPLVMFLRIFIAQLLVLLFV